MEAHGDTQGHTFMELLETLVELVHDACLVLGPDGTVLLGNKRASRLYGRAPDEIAGTPIGDVCAPESRDALLRELAELPADGSRFNSVHLRADGSHSTVRVSLKRGTLCGRDIVFATVLDDCEHVDAEEERIKSAAFDAALDPIIVHDTDGMLLHFNTAAAESAGMTPEEYARIGPWGWVPAERRGSIGQRLHAIVSNGSMTFESAGTRTDGSAFTSEVHARTLDLAGRTVIVSVSRDVTERKRAEAAVHEMAYHDTLTGLPNRSLLSERAEQAMADVHRHGDLLALAFIDLDDFKPINDAIGHHAGDDVLRTIAARLVATVRTNDTVARFGGDEFVVMLPRLPDRDAIERVASKLAQVVRAPIETAERTILVTASIGLAVYDPTEDGFSSLLSKADMAMYSAKRAGVRWRLFDEHVVPL